MREETLYKFNTEITASGANIVEARNKILALLSKAELNEEIDSFGVPFEGEKAGTRVYPWG